MSNPDSRMSQQVFEQSVLIHAPANVVEQCVTERMLMHRWLNPALRCEPIGLWSTEVGAKSQFVLQIPWLQPSLQSVVVQRQANLIVWEFTGFFQGRDRWEWHPLEQSTQLLNRFEFEIPNPWVRFGFQTFAAGWTQADMQAQLQRLKQVAETIVGADLKI